MVLRKEKGGKELKDEGSRSGRKEGRKNEEKKEWKKAG